MSLVRRSEHGEAEIFFDLFPCSKESFSVATATRMNASFPYISPAVNLPTCEPRRVVDAGYYDNYGVSLASAFLALPQIRDWIAEHTSGVLLVEMRAFPLGLPGEQGCNVGVSAPSGQFALDTGWLTNPFQSIAASRSGAMVFRDQQELRALKELYGETPFDVVTFVNSSQASLNWYLPEGELAQMRKCFEEEWDRNERILRSIWRKKRATSTDAMQ